VKARSESIAPWDYYKIRRIIPAQEAAQPLAQSKCAPIGRAPATAARRLNRFTPRRVNQASTKKGADESHTTVPQRYNRIEYLSMNSTWCRLFAHVSFRKFAGTGGRTS
jgi:hypothetical protein